MLIEFKVGNFRSFKETVTLSMVAANISAPDESVDENNIFKVDDELSLLKCAAIYGANGSGKSNLAAAFRFVRKFILTSSKEGQSGEGIQVEEFRLSDETKGKPSFFEIIFLMDDAQYRYGFEVDKEQVHAEWLFHVPKSREAKLFERRGGRITASRTFKEARGLEDKTRINALFLSVLAQFNGPTAKAILQWVRSSMNVISGLNDLGYRQYTIQCFHNNLYKEQIVDFIKELDLGFEDISIESPEELQSEGAERKGPADDIAATDFSSRRLTPSDLLRIQGNIKTTHRSYNNEGEPTSLEMFDIDHNESEGTRKLFFLAGPLMDTLKNGKILFIDEFDARLHPLITHQIIRLFNSKDTNRNNAQLIFATHDTNLLSNRVFRRDQIWFTEKDRFGATHLHSLVEYKTRNDASFEKDYIKGKYGGIPFIGNLADLFGASNGQAS